MTNPSSKLQTAAVTMQCVGRLVIFLHGKGAPTDEEWHLVLELFASQSLVPLRVLVFTEGATPSPSQQARLSKVLGRAARTLPVAVVSDSIAVRFVVSALALFLPRIRTFRPQDLTLACRYLELDDTENRAAIEFVASFVKT
jgi:hypothetical protein